MCQYTYVYMPYVQEHSPNITFLQLLNTVLYWTAAELLPTTVLTLRKTEQDGTQRTL